MLTEQTQLLARYQRIRQVGLHLNQLLVKRLTRQALEEGARALGILRKGVMVFQSEDMTSVLMDYCIHDVRRQGRTVVEEMLAEGKYSPGTDETLYLEALRQAKYGIFLVERTVPGVGVDVLDVIRGNRLRIVDVNFSRSSASGLALATRICTPGEFTMTTGATLPIGLLTPKAQAEYVKEIAEAPGPGLDEMSPDKRSKAIAEIIRSAIRSGAAEHVEYQDAGKYSPGSASGRSAQSKRTGRNDLCPCGSGRKYKRCCARRG